MGNQTLSEIKIIPFLEALHEGKRDGLGCDQDTFERLAKEYIDRSKEKKNNFEVRLEAVEQKIFLLMHTLHVLSIEVADEDMMQVLRDQGYTMRHDYYFDDLALVLKDMKILEFKRDNLKAKLPKKKKTPKKDREDTNIFSILTGVSTGLEMSMDFQSMVVTEFIAWKKQLDRKIKSLEKNKPKK